MSLDPVQLDHPEPGALHADRMGRLFAEAVALHAALDAVRSDAEARALIDALETLSLGVAETRASSLEACRQKATLLRLRLLDQLDPMHQGDAVTLAVVASLVLDLTALAD